MGGHALLQSAPRTEPGSPALQTDSVLSAPQRKLVRASRKEQTRLCMVEHERAPGDTSTVRGTELTAVNGHWETKDVILPYNKEPAGRVLRLLRY